MLLKSSCKWLSQRMGYPHFKQFFFVFPNQTSWKLGGHQHLLWRCCAIRIEPRFPFGCPQSEPIGIFVHEADRVEMLICTTANRMQWLRAPSSAGKQLRRHQPCTAGTPEKATATGGIGIGLCQTQLKLVWPA